MTSTFRASLSVLGVIALAATAQAQIIAQPFQQRLVWLDCGVDRAPIDHRPQFDLHRSFPVFAVCASLRETIEHRS